MIDAKQVSKRVGHRTILDDVTFQAGPGGCAGLTGGQAESSIVLLRILATLVRPSAGQIVLNGIDVVREPVEARRRLLYVGAGFSRPLAGLRVDESLWLLARVRGIEVRDHAVDEAVQAAGLNGGNVVDRLSADELDTFVLAAIGLLRPAAVLIEEPLLSGSAERVIGRIRDIHGDHTTVVVASNDPAVLEKCCDRIVHLERAHHPELRERRALPEPLEPLEPLVTS
jgi:ABC-type multidrug transport system ATPase subunit